ncbi:2-C-methyl-D-erythritol 4-phosphate cytidylyltransferase [Actinoalloteichus spitiensis]|uniref:2-C-methyl-D-erythritol 4-phosphate cytidylyltransferase n=1 Tax=Actinoalloteichus spitiensis TaxID=252394 RepID=UPI000379FAC0|nr:2-C-methyl-D-erythritol 4-phosphate cytidylyltransferase [Actinoalloteichus spitiensis]
MSVVALVPAAGHGVRLGAGRPKALVVVAGEPLLVRAVRALVESGCVDRVVVAAPEHQLSEVSDLLAPFGRAVDVVAGGGTRSDSVRLALGAALTALPDTSVVLVHDAARAFMPTSVIRSVVDTVRAGAGAVTPVLPLADTVKEVDATGFVRHTPDRSLLRLTQTPQAFAVDVLLRAHGLAARATQGEAPEGASRSGRFVAGPGATDDAGLVERRGEKVLTVPGHPHGFKITTPLDLVVAEALAEATGGDHAPERSATSGE